MKVKICGTASIEAARMAAEAGADYIGSVVEVGFSERSVTIAEARHIRRATTAPFVVLCFEQSRDWIAEAVEIVQPAAIQLLGHEPVDLVRDLKPLVACEIWKTLFLPAAREADSQDSLERTIREQMLSYAAAGVDRLLLDTMDAEGKRFGGTGKTSDWELAAALIAQAPVLTFLSGGIHAGNARQAILEVQPYGIDLCSGVESEKGKRDPNKLKALMQAIADLR